MKKKILFLPFVLLITCAWAQTPTQDKKLSALKALDGKAYKIEMTREGMTEDPKIHSGTSDEMVKPDHSATGKSTTKENKSEEAMSNKSAVIEFENGFLRTSFMAMKGIESCPYTVVDTKTTESISFSASCGKSTGTQSVSSCTWNGTITGKKIQGSLNVVKVDGKNISYIFTGSETDVTKDLGAK